MRAANWVVLGLLLLVFAPLSSADHVYSHRYLVHGRVVDAEGRFLAAEIVQVRLVGFELDFGPCHDLDDVLPAESPDLTVVLTGEEGIFRVCRHVDAAIPPDAQVHVRVRDVEEVFAADVRHRETFAGMVMPDSGERASDPLRPYVVRGTVWQPIVGGTTLEGVGVEGLAVGSSPVIVRLHSSNATVEETVESHPYYGWYEARFEAPPPIEPTGYVQVLAGGVAAEGALDEAFLFTQVHVDLPPKLGSHIAAPLVMASLAIVAGLVTRMAILRRAA